MINAKHLLPLYIEGTFLHDNMRNTCKNSVGNPNGRNHLVGVGVNGMIMLNWTMKRCVVHLRV
jgi:hypothetical protein